MKGNKFLKRLAVTALTATMTVGVVPATAAMTATNVFAAQNVTFEANDAYVGSTTDDAAVTKELTTKLNEDNLTVEDSFTAAGRTIENVVTTNYTVTNITVESAEAPTFKITPSGGVLVMPLLHLKGDVVKTTDGTPYGTVKFTAYSTKLTKTEEIAAAKAVVEGVGGTEFDPSTNPNSYKYKNDDNSSSVKKYVEDILKNKDIKLANDSSKDITTVLTHFQSVAGTGLNGVDVTAVATQDSLTKATKTAAGSEKITVNFKLKLNKDEYDLEYDSKNTNDQFVEGSASYTATINKLTVQSSDDSYQAAVEKALKDVTFTNADFSDATKTAKTGEVKDDADHSKGAYDKIKNALGNVGVKEWDNTHISVRNLKTASHKEDGSVEVLLDDSRDGESEAVQYATVTLPITHADDLSAVEPEVAKKLVASDKSLVADSVAVQAQNTDKAAQKKDAEAAIKAQIEKDLEDKLDGTNTIGSEIDKVEVSIADTDFHASTADTAGQIDKYSVTVTYKNEFTAKPSDGTSYSVNDLGTDKHKVTYVFNHAVKLYKLSSNAATGIALNDSYSMNASKGELKITPNFTPSNANKYLIRWTLKSKDKFNVKDGTAYENYNDTDKYSGAAKDTVYTKNEALDLVATGDAQVGDSVDITAQLIDADGLVAATAKTTVKYVVGFDDVQNKYDYAYDAITYMSNEQTVSVDGKDAKIAVISGVGDNKFNPNGNVTRAQFITFLYRADQTIKNNEKKYDADLVAVSDVASAYLQDTKETGKPGFKAEFTLNDGSKRTLYYKNDTANHKVQHAYKTYTTAKAQTKFTDVAAGAYYAKAVDWAVANGIAAGKTATTFDPNAVVTRAEAVTFLQRYFAAGQKYNVSSKFVDVKSTDFFADAVGWATANGVTQGKDETHFAPKDTTTRKEAAAFIYRALSASDNINK